TLKAAGYWGNEFYGTSGFSPKTKLNNATKMFSIRFVARQNENIFGVRLLTQVTNKGEVVEPGGSMGKADDNNWWRIRICSDNASNPGKPGSVLNDRAGNPADRASHPDKIWSWEWFMPYPRMEVEYENGVALTGGQTYHIVISENLTAPDYVSAENYIIIVATKPRQPDDRWINSATYNTNRGVLFSSDNGETWEDSFDPGSIVYDREPVY
ncbi:MAG: hypothetical protein QMD00_06300, partial [Hadesarchaea archaeon]|nr:hypothetical protein [Hadesarchaea archaeon]